MKFIKLVIAESILLALTVGIAIFLTSAVTALPFIQVPLLPVIYISAILYVARLAILIAVRNESKVRYKKLRSDARIKVFKEPPKSTVWKKLIWIVIILLALFLLYQCVHQMGMENFELPINLGSRWGTPQ